MAAIKCRKKDTTCLVAVAFDPDTHGDIAAFLRPQCYRLTLDRGMAVSGVTTLLVEVSGMPPIRMNRGEYLVWNCGELLHRTSCEFQREYDTIPG